MIKRHKCWKKPNDSRPSNTAKAAFYLPSLMVYAHNLHNMYVLCTVRQYDQKAQMLEKHNDSRPSNTAKAAFYVPSLMVYAHNLHKMYVLCTVRQYDQKAQMLEKTQ